MSDTIGMSFALVTPDGDDLVCGTLYDLRQWIINDAASEVPQLPSLDESWEGSESAPVLHMDFNGSEVYQMDLEETRGFLAQLASVL